MMQIGGCSLCSMCLERARAWHAEHAVSIAAALGTAVLRIAGMPCNPMSNHLSERLVLLVHMLRQLPKRQFHFHSLFCEAPACAESSTVAVESQKVP